VSKEAYGRLSKEQSEWLCPRCSMSGLPFANSSLNSLAESSTANTPVLPYANAPISPASTVDHDTSLDTVNTTVEYTPPNSLHCRSLNARSVMNKKEDIKVMLTSDHLDVLAITETFLCDVILDSELVDDDYVIFRRDRDRHGGGDKTKRPRIRL